MNTYQKSQGWKRRKHKKRRSSHKQSFFRKIPLKNVGLALVALALAGFFVLFISIIVLSRTLPDPNSLTEREISQTTKIYDRTGEHLLYEVFGEENRTLAKIQEGFCKDDEEIERDENGIPLFALQATIAAEDRNFCSHKGFDAKGLARAVYLNLRGQRVGGSTLTQQLVKNAILSNEKTLTRKFKELILSIELERRYSKDEIIQIYFNEIPYGSTYYGIQAASLNYFNKEVHELTIAEAATLAALPKAPSRYLNNPELLNERRDYILDSMNELGFLDESTLASAKEEETPVRVNISNIKAPHFVFHVKEQLDERFGQREVQEGGLKIITSLDFEKQEIAERAVREGVEARGESLGFTNASLVAVDPKTGEVLSMVGSKDYFDDEIDGQVNVATRLRQPGSSFKPIVYTRAFEMGYTPNTILWDVDTTFPTATGPYNPKNYDLEEHGPVRLRQALQGSLNIPAVKLLGLVGVENALDFSKKLGYTSFEDRSRFGLAVVLGGGEVQLLEHVSAYGAFANDGIHQETVSILSVEDADGELIYEWEPTRGTRAVEQNAARMISNVLSDNAARAYVFGTGSPLQLGGRPVAAKTGTTNNAHDAWTLGYTPSLAVGVWGGNNDNTQMNQGAGGSSVAAPIWNQFMREALTGTAVESFASPTIPITGKNMIDGSLEAETVVIDRASEKRATEFTPPSYREEKQFARYHTILHYINPSDPLGAPPSNPAAHSQYNAWEGGVLNWITRQEEETGIKISQEEPPTEDDDVHIPANFPNVSIESPTNNTRFESRSLLARANAEAARGVVRVEFYLDGFFLGADTRAPYELNTQIPNTIARGFHTLKAIAYDDVGNSGTDTVGLRLNSESAEINFQLTDPKNGQTIEKTTDEFVVVTSLQRPTTFERVTVFAQPIGSTGKLVVGSIANPSSPFLTFPWTLPEAGDWVISARATERDTGDTIDTAGVIVQVIDPQSGDTEPSEDESPDEALPINDLNPFL